MYYTTQVRAFICGTTRGCSMPRIKATQGDLLDAGITWFASRATTDFDGRDGRAYFTAHTITPKQRKTIAKWKNISVRKTMVPAGRKTVQSNVIILFDKCRVSATTPGP